MKVLCSVAVHILSLRDNPLVLHVWLERPFAECFGSFKYYWCSISPLFKNTMAKHNEMKVIYTVLVLSYACECQNLQFFFTITSTKCSLSTRNRQDNCKTFRFTDYFLAIYWRAGQFHHIIVVNVITCIVTSFVSRQFWIYFLFFDQIHTNQFFFCKQSY